MKIKENPLPKNTQTSLSDWLNQEQGDTMVMVWRHKAFKLRCEAAQILSNLTTSAKSEADAKTKEADAIENSIKLFEETKKNTKFCTYTATAI